MSSIITLPKWARRQDASIERWTGPKSRRPLDGPVPSDDDIRPRLKLPPDMEQSLQHAIDGPFGAPLRTAQIVADELAHLRDELALARELIAKSETKELELVAERDRRIDEEIAAKKATHDAEVAELEGLRPSTGEPA